MLHCTSGTLAIQLWATDYAYSGSGTMFGYKLTETSLGTLQGGYFIYNVVRTQVFLEPPPGNYNIVFVLAEWNGYTYVTVDYRNFSVRQTFGSPIYAPSITGQPQSLALNAGQSGTLSVSVSGTSPFSYQWFKNGTAIGGATGATLSFANAQTSDSGSYTVSVSNIAGAVTSGAATLTVNAFAPSIVTQPSSQTITVGGSVTFSVAASGTAPLNYQWRKTGANIGGAVGSSYTISNVQTNAAGSYTVFVSNAGGSITSSAATLTVSTTATVRPTLSSPLWTRTNGFSLNLPTQNGFTYRVQTSTNLAQWSDLISFTGDGSAKSIADTMATNLTRRFYRVVSP